MSKTYFVTTYPPWAMDGSGNIGHMFYSNFFLLHRATLWEPLTFRRLQAQTVRDGLCCRGLGHSKFQRASKFHDFFKSCGNFDVWVDFKCWLSYIGKGLRLQPAQ